MKLGELSNNSFEWKNVTFYGGKIILGPPTYFQVSRPPPPRMYTAVCLWVYRRHNWTSSQAGTSNLGRTTCRIVSGALPRGQRSEVKVMKCRHIWASSAVRALVSRLNGYSSRSLFVQVPVDVFDGVLRSRVWEFLEADGVQRCSRLGEILSVTQAGFDCGRHRSWVTSSCGERCSGDV